MLLSTFVMAIANIGANYVLIFGKLGFLPGDHEQDKGPYSLVWA